MFGVCLLKAVRKLSAEHGRVVLLPMEDSSLIWVVNNWDKIADFVHAILPGVQSLRVAESKSETIELVRSMGLPCPRTLVADSMAGLQEAVERFIDKGYVIKPSTGTGSAGVLYGEAGVKHDLRTHRQRHETLLIQERIPAEGRGLGVSLLMDARGNCLASFAHERLQQYPNSGGPSTDRISIAAPELVDMSIRLMQRLSWRGVAMVEWKDDPRDNVPKLMEINPRFWGSLELSVRAGVDFPLLYARACLGEKLEPVHQYAIGKRCRWMFPGEILRYLTQSTAKREPLKAFLKGFFCLSEEWDPKDIRGWLAVIACGLALALHPRYWKYVRRG
jgi:predicted ATP-grasp superfamily ATP-dependent carboligase